MNNAKLQLEVGSPTSIKCGHKEWVALDTKLVGKLKALLEDNKILKENAINNDKVVDKVNWENRLLKDRINKAIEYIKTNTYKTPFENYKYLQISDEEIDELLDILRGEDNGNN